MERKKVEITIEASWDRVYDCDSLNPKQQEVFDAIQPIVSAYLGGKPHPQVNIISILPFFFPYSPHQSNILPHKKKPFYR